MAIPLLKPPRLMAVLTFFLLSGCSLWGGRGAGYIVVENQRTQEQAAVQYRHKSGRVDAAALHRISIVMRDMNNGTIGAIDPKLIDFMADVRDGLHLSARTPLIVTSGYRSRATQSALRRADARAADNSYHLRGQAVDFKIAGVSPSRISAVALGLQRGGVAVYPHSGHVHLDCGAARTWKTW